jgi:hypothetical protein
MNKATVDTADRSGLRARENRLGGRVGARRKFAIAFTFNQRLMRAELPKWLKSTYDILRVTPLINGAFTRKLLLATESQS